MKLQKDTLERHGIDKTSRRVLETIPRCYPDSIEINKLCNIPFFIITYNINAKT